VHVSLCGHTAQPLVVVEMVQAVRGRVPDVADAAVLEEVAEENGRWRAVGPANAGGVESETDRGAGLVRVLACGRDNARTEKGGGWGRVGQE